MDAGEVLSTPFGSESSNRMIADAELALLIRKGTARKDLTKSRGSPQCSPTLVESKPGREDKAGQKVTSSASINSGTILELIRDGFVIVCNFSLPGISRTLYMLKSVIQSLKILGSWILPRWRIGIIRG
jgi:hypothetical protein